MQVFKGYPADDLVPAMQFITNALGVDCDFCHVDRAPDKDDKNDKNDKKEKQTVRKMITTTRAINHDPLGLNPTELDLADYRDAGGVKIPFRWTVARPSGRFTIQIDESQQNVPLDDRTFEKAPQAPPS